MTEIRVAILAPSPALRAGLAHLLKTDGQIAVTAEASNLLALQELPAETNLLLLAGIENEDSLSLQIFEAAWPEAYTSGEENIPALLLLTDNPEPLQGFLEEFPSAWGLLSLDSTPADLITAVKAVCQGLLVTTPLLLRRLLHPAAQYDGEELIAEPLTAREAEVLQLLAHGLANKQIALSLGISEHTAKFHISSIYAKLGAVNRTEAVRKGVRQGIILL